MRSSRKWTVVLALLLVAAGLVVLGLYKKHQREHVLADGSVLRLAKVHFGKEEPYQITNLREEMEGWLQKWLPKSWTIKWFKPPSATSMVGRSSWYMNAVSHTNNDALRIWLTRRAPASTNYEDVAIMSAELVDAHGCSLLVTKIGGSDDGRLPRGRPGFGGQGSVEWLLFEAFPRHEKEFRLRVYDQQHNFLTEFMVKNPAFTPTRPTTWQIEPFPISKTSKSVTFVLTDVAIKSNAPAVAPRPQPYKQQLSVQPTFKFLENGVPTTAWQALDMELWDSSGNFASKIWPAAGRAGPGFLCPYEPAWKLRVKFYGSETSKEGSNIVWTIPKISVPAAGEFTNLDVRRTVLANQIDVLALAGPGKFTYSNEVPIKATAELPDRDAMYPFTGQRSGNNRTTGAIYSIQDVSFRTPHIAMYVRGLKNDERLTICATDERGRKCYARNWEPQADGKDSTKPDEINYLDNRFSYRTGALFYQLDLPTDSKTVDLTLCVHYPTVEEFVFKPPR